MEKNLVIPLQFTGNAAFEVGLVVVVDGFEGGFTAVVDFAVSNCPIFKTLKIDIMPASLFVHLPAVLPRCGIIWECIHELNYM